MGEVAVVWMRILSGRIAVKNRESGGKFLGRGGYNRGRYWPDASLHRLSGYAAWPPRTDYQETQRPCNDYHQTENYLI